MPKPTITCYCICVPCEATEVALGLSSVDDLYLLEEGGGRSKADLNRSNEGLCATEEGLVGVIDDEEVLLVLVVWLQNLIMVHGQNSRFWVFFR